MDLSCTWYFSLFFLFFGAFLLIVIAFWLVVFGKQECANRTNPLYFRSFILLHSILRFFMSLLLSSIFLRRILLYSLSSFPVSFTLSLSRSLRPLFASEFFPTHNFSSILWYFDVRVSLSSQCEWFFFFIVSIPFVYSPSLHYSRHPDTVSVCLMLQNGSCFCLRHSGFGFRFRCTEPALRFTYIQTHRFTVQIETIVEEEETRMPRTKRCNSNNNNNNNSRRMEKGKNT